MFLLVSVRHVGAHGVSIQISINLGKTFLRISRIRNIPLTWILARIFVYVPPFISQILDFIYWTVLIFFYLFWMTSHWKSAIFSEDAKYFCFYLYPLLYIISVCISHYLDCTSSFLNRHYFEILPLLWNALSGKNKVRIYMLLVFLLHICKTLKKEGRAFRNIG